jgi:flagellar protein FlaJ
MALLKVQFLDVIAELAEQAPGSGGEASSEGSTSSVTNVNVNLLSMMFFHAVTLQAVSAGIISGYLRDARVLAGVKFVVILATLALVVWIPI